MQKRIFKLAHKITKAESQGFDYQTTFGQTLSAITVALTRVSLQHLIQDYKERGILALKEACGDVKHDYAKNIKQLAKELVRRLNSTKQPDVRKEAMSLGAVVVTPRRMSTIVKTQHSMLEVYQARKWEYQIMLNGD